MLPCIHTHPKELHSPLMSLSTAGSRLVRLSVLLSSVAFVLVASAGATAAQPEPPQPASQPAPPQPASQPALHDAMRKLWEDHIVWTRLFVVSDLADLPDLQATTDRLLQNQVDIGNAIKPYYGDAAGDQLTALLKDHILIAADVVAAAKSNDSAALQSSMARWQSNADDIAEFLGAANPDSWPADEMKSMMRQHLDLTTAEVVAHLKGDWSADVAAYDKVHEHILMLADQLSDGIVAQFPESAHAQ
jgi:hypothetical protein